MSLENELARIADALFQIAEALEVKAEKQANPLMVIPPPPVGLNPITNQIKDLPPVVDQGPLAIPVVNAPVAVPVAPVAAEVLPTTTKELLELAQDVASKLEDKCPAFVAWCNTALLPKYNVNKIKLIPQTEVAAAAKEVIGYAAKMGIKV